MQVRHKSDTSANGTILTTVQLKAYFHTPIGYITNKKLQGVEQFHSKNYLLEMPCSHAKMRLKSEPEKLNFIMAKALSNSYALNCKCPCTFPNCYA